MTQQLKKIKTLFPLLLFIVIALFLWKGLDLNPHRIPSPLIGKAFPSFHAESLQNPDKKITQDDFKGKVTLLNVFATWCYSCRAEHAVLMDVHRQNDQINFIGLDYKDERTDALQWLKQLGNPYANIIFDPHGKLALDLGVYGTPETYVIDEKGIIRYKHIGPLSPDDWQEKVLPVIQRLAGVLRKPSSFPAKAGMTEKRE